MADRKEYMKEYQKKNRERLNAYRREWYKKNPERCREATKRWEQKKKEEKKTSEYFKTVAQIIEQLEKEELKND